MIRNKIRNLFKTKEQLLIEQKIRRDRFDAYVDHVYRLHGTVYKGVKYNPIPPPPPTPEGTGGSGRDMVAVTVLMFVFIVSVMMLVRLITQECG